MLDLLNIAWSPATAEFLGSTPTGVGLFIYEEVLLLCQAAADNSQVLCVTAQELVLSCDFLSPDEGYFTNCVPYGDEVGF